MLFCRLGLSGWIKSRDEIHSSQTELLMRLTQEEMFAMFAFPSLGSGMSVVRPHSTSLSLSLFLAHRTILLNLSPRLLYVSLQALFSKSYWGRKHSNKYTSRELTINQLLKSGWIVTDTLTGSTTSLSDHNLLNEKNDKP